MPKYDYCRGKAESNSSRTKLSARETDKYGSERLHGTNCTNEIWEST
jgi:hypothetical protein